MNYLRIEGWEEERIVHGFGTKGQPGDKITRQEWRGSEVILREEHFPLISLKQVHGDGIRIFQGPAQKISDLWEKEGDAILTPTPRVAIGVFTADCLPLLLFEPEKRIVAVVHAGWRGTAQEVVRKIIEKMIDGFDCCREKIKAALGPCIGPCCYEVDEPVEQTFRRNGLPWDFFSSPRGPGKWLLGLQKANSFILEKAGVNKKNINLIKYCTACRTDLFFSYRKEKGTRGRQVNFIALP